MTNERRFFSLYRNKHIAAALNGLKEYENYRKGLPIETVETDSDRNLLTPQSPVNASHNDGEVR